MKYVLVNKYDEIVDRVEIASGVGNSGARTYFVKRKQIDEEEFNKLVDKLLKKVGNIISGLDEILEGTC